MRHADTAPRHPEARRQPLVAFRTRRAARQRRRRRGCTRRAVLPSRRSDQAGHRESPRRETGSKLDPGPRHHAGLDGVRGKKEISAPVHHPYIDRSGHKSVRQLPVSLFFSAPKIAFSRHLDMGLDRQQHLLLCAWPSAPRSRKRSRDGSCARELCATRKAVQPDVTVRTSPRFSPGLPQCGGSGRGGVATPPGAPPSRSIPDYAPHFVRFPERFGSPVAIAVLMLQLPPCGYPDLGRERK